VHRQPRLARDHVDVRGVLQRRVRELVLRIVEQALGLALPVLRGELVLGLFECLDRGRLDPSSFKM